MNKSTTNSARKWTFWCAFVFIGLSGPLLAQKKQPAVYTGDKGLQYRVEENGDQLIDFSYAGYKASETSISDVPVKVFVPFLAGDQTTRIQKAIDHVGGLPLDMNGFRGAVLLDKGTFEVAGGLILNRSGVVLRGSGVSATKLLGTGLDRTTLIRVAGTNDKVLQQQIVIADEYVPVGAMSFRLEDCSSLSIGDHINITRPSTKEWIALLGTQDFGGETGYIGWKANERNVVWEREILSIAGNQITIDAPITVAIDKQYGGGFIQKMSWNGRIANLGIENLELSSTYNTENPKDEQHRWMAVTMENVRDAWVRQVNFKHFAGSAVAIWNTGSRITIEDCKSQEPVSEIGGQRRYTFFTEGEQCFFQRIYSEYGYHDFGVGFMAAGPNAFVECQSYLPYSFSGAIDSWASGVLFDIVNVDGQALRFSNRGMEAQGAGWTAANSMFWQCSASFVDCPAPPTAMNYAYAVWSQFGGNGDWYEANGFLKPRSLFYGQLRDRLKADVSNRAALLPMTTEATSSPTLEEAETYVNLSHQPRLQLQDWIDQASERNLISVDPRGALDVDIIKSTKRQTGTENQSLTIRSSRIFLGDNLGVGSRHATPWWRGNVRAYDAMKAKPAITRYVPGRIGTGLTDDFETIIPQLKSAGVTIVDHNYGLWYDRRRDDHERIRRMNGEVWAPFYELPFARSGKGTAWDGLSKYDLTKYNFWYWNRLQQFADLAEEAGMVLFHQHYFQHNILEAGAHYADFPWRTANNVNNTPFAEPVNYAGDKRIFVADQFYDVSNPEYRALHQAYIRKCLDNFASQPNVIHFIGEEYTGPLKFMQFWIDEVSQWMTETGNDPVIALSATKDVQDAILADPVRSQIIDVIDIKYWYFGYNKKTESDELYAPDGGKNLAPRQHARIVKTPKETFESTYKAVRMYADKYPDKSIIHTTYRSDAFGWAIFMAGGSLMNIPKMNRAFIADAMRCDLFEADVKVSAASDGEGIGQYIMKSASGEQIIYVKDDFVKIDLKGIKGRFELNWINAETGEILQKEMIQGGEEIVIKKLVSSVVWINKR